MRQQIPRNTLEQISSSHVSQAQWFITSLRVHATAQILQFLVAYPVTALLIWSHFRSHYFLSTELHILSVKHDLSLSQTPFLCLLYWESNTVPKSVLPPTWLNVLPKDIIETKWNVLLFSHSVVSNSFASTDCSLRGPSVHGILQARILEWIAISFSRGSSGPRDRTHVSCIGRWILNY